MGLGKLLAVALTLAALVLAATACSGSGGSSGGSSTGGGTETYTNGQYGFSLTYDTMLTQGTPSGGSSSGTGSAFDIAFVDANGTQSGSKYLDGLQVSVYVLARALKPSEVPGLKGQVEGIVNQLMAKLTSARVLEPLSTTTVNGVPGFTVSYSFVQEGVKLSAASYFLFAHEHEYEITGQASAGSWNELSPTLNAAIQSFTVK